jgi:hypothetical protein
MNQEMNNPYKKTRRKNRGFISSYSGHDAFNARRVSFEGDDETGSMKRQRSLSSNSSADAQCTMNNEDIVTPGKVSSMHQKVTSNDVCNHCEGVDICLLFSQEESENPGDQETSTCDNVGANDDNDWEYEGKKSSQDPLKDNYMVQSPMPECSEKTPSCVGRTRATIHTATSKRKSTPTPTKGTPAVLAARKKKRQKSTGSDNQRKVHEFLKPVAKPAQDVVLEREDDDSIEDDTTNRPSRGNVMVPCYTQTLTQVVRDQDRKIHDAASSSNCSILPRDDNHDDQDDEVFEDGGLDSRVQELSQEWDTERIPAIEVMETTRRHLDNITSHVYHPPIYDNYGSRKYYLGERWFSSECRNTIFTIVGFRLTGYTLECALCIKSRRMSKTFLKTEGENSEFNMLWIKEDTKKADPIPLKTLTHIVPESEVEKPYVWKENRNNSKGACGWGFAYYHDCSSTAKTVSQKPTVLELFSGVGGMTLGFDEAGFDVRWMVENNSETALALKVNHSERDDSLEILATCLANIYLHTILIGGRQTSPTEEKQRCMLRMSESSWTGYQKKRWITQRVVR